MAIQKSKTLLDGRTGNYWVTDVVTVSPDYSSSRAMLDLYVSEAAYVSGSAPIYSTEVILQSSDNPVVRAKLVELLEDKIVTLPGDFLSGTVL
jgi:hypothetical protein